MSNDGLSPFQSEVNCIKWDPTGSLLASCSDDMTAKVNITHCYGLTYHHIIVSFVGTGFCSQTFYGISFIR